jgi:hypothetical protein
LGLSHSLSLIEFIADVILTISVSSGTIVQDRKLVLSFVQNNCETTEQNADQVYAKYLEEYFIWEDQDEE